MVDETTDHRSSALREVKADMDERRIARGVAIVLPIVTITLASAAALLLGPPIAILVLAAGMLLGVISLFWASLRVLSGDAALSPELEALDATAHAVDALSSRKRMLVRALKDLDNERALGKLEDDDYEQLSSTYRNELKEVLKRIDASLEPHRSKAEDAARAHLIKVGLVDGGDRGEPLPPKSATVLDDDDDDDNVNDDDAKVSPTPAATVAPSRVTCSACATSNEIDASFCKKCGASLANDVANANAPTKVDADEA